MWSIAQLRKKKETKRKNEKKGKYRNIHIQYKLTAIVDVFLADSTTTFTISMDERERLAYRITTVSLTKHFQRNMCHLSNPIKVGWFAREGHPLHSLCGLISVDFIFGGGGLASAVQVMLKVSFIMTELLLVLVCSKV